MRGSALVIILFLSFACNNNKAEKAITVAPKPPPPKYYFYPKANVYFDTINKNYIFLASDNKTWESVKQIPAAMQVMMDKNILIDTPSQPVWKDNERHKLIYSALLYASPADTQANVAVKPEIKPESKPEKKKGGLKRFFDKIFGKKKKGTQN